jgi:uncharacterized membrane protein YciS (DUF1049 family)
MLLLLQRRRFLLLLLIVVVVVAVVIGSSSDDLVTTQVSVADEVTQWMNTQSRAWTTTIIIKIENIDMEMFCPLI